MANIRSEAEEKLLLDVREARETGAVVRTFLKTDERVFARITDGIYREPASAIRELIANAYDADATVVRVETDSPRFSQIVVRDNGHGLTEEALVHVICHIGGSLKRDEDGADFKVVSTDDSTLSPGGRKLIGKLGIGLFSVSQITHHLTIVTKVAGESVRRVCDILLMPQRDEVKQSSDKSDKKFVTGSAQIKTISAEDVESQGTEIILHELRPYVRESLQSSSMWAAISKEPPIPFDEYVSPLASSQISEADDDNDVADSDGEDEFLTVPPVPTFHIGRVSRKDPEVLVTQPQLPWTNKDSPLAKFKKLVTGIQSLESGVRTHEKVKLEEVLDTYFRTIWTISLSIPAPYVHRHPFSITGEDKIQTYSLSNKTVRPRAEEIVLTGAETIRSKCGFLTPECQSNTPFDVYFDDILLRRPIVFESQREISNGKSLLFVGRIKSDMTNLPREYSGGPIDLEAYFYWQPRIVPVEHNGILVRIHGASGVMFDDQFLKYQVSEQNRLRQLTAEVFVNKGLDSALNIDRESFNVAHPHYQFLKRWVHNALRQVVTKHKSLAKSDTDLRLIGGLSDALEVIAKISSEVKQGVPKKTTVIAESETRRQSFVETTFDKKIILSSREALKSSTTKNKLRERLIEEQAVAVAKILDEYEFFRILSPEEKNELLRKIVAIFSVEIK
jgi:hypothetical protein